MDYRIEKRPAFRIAERVAKVSVDDGVKGNTIPKFWDELRADGTIDKLCGLAEESELFGICYGNIPADAKEFEYSVAAEYDGKKPLPEDLRVGEVPAQTWAVFPCKGAMPNAIQDMWYRVYTEFFPGSEYRPVGGVDIEVYPEGDMSSPDYRSEIRVAVEKK